MHAYRMHLYGAALLAFLASGCSFTQRYGYTDEFLAKPWRYGEVADRSPELVVPSDAAEAEQERVRTRATRQLSFVPRTPVASPVDCDGHFKSQPRVLVLLALSGGGHRAAFFSAMSMFELKALQAGKGKLDVLQDVDLISAVSGGSLPAAYYAISQDDESPCIASSGRYWRRAEVGERMTHAYLKSWIGRWFLPNNIAKFWFSPFDRTDIMAEVFSHYMYSDAKGDSLSMMQLNPVRPNLVINATVGSSANDNDPNPPFGSIFTFTHEDFSEQICADISRYTVGRAVMASSTFPGVFSFMTLRNFCTEERASATAMPGDKIAPRYLHVFDGGNADNLGLTSLKRVLLGPDGEAELVLSPDSPYDKIVIIQIDAFVDSTGADPDKPDPRSWSDYFVDSNFVDATDSLLEENRDRLLREFKRRQLQAYDAGDEGRLGQRQVRNLRDCIKDGIPPPACVQSLRWWAALNDALKRKLLFIHVDFSAVNDDPGMLLQQQLRSISTVSLRSAGEKGAPIDDREAIELGVERIFREEHCPKDPAGRAASICHCWDLLGEIMARPAEVDLNRDDNNYFCPLGAVELPK